MLKFIAMNSPTDCHETAASTQSCSNKVNGTETQCAHLAHNQVLKWCKTVSSTINRVIILCFSSSVCLNSLMHRHRLVLQLIRLTFQSHLVLHSKQLFYLLIKSFAKSVLLPSQAACTRSFVWKSTVINVGPADQSRG